jgi:hypothetical protein
MLESEHLLCELVPSMLQGGALHAPQLTKHYDQYENADLPSENESQP